jgi:hypothetical protein
MKKYALLSALCVLFSAATALAQPGSGGPSPTPPAVDPAAVPLDGGASLLLASGVAFGLKKLRERRKAR